MVFLVSGAKILQVPVQEAKYNNNSKKSLHHGLRNRGSHRSQASPSLLELTSLNYLARECCQKSTNCWSNHCND